MTDHTEVEHMESAVSYRWSLIAFCAVLAALVSASPGAAQTVSGQAFAAQTIVRGLLGTTVTTLANTGTLGGSDDARQASAPTGAVPSLVSGAALHATTIGWPDQVMSEASLADLTVNVGGTTIGAAFVMARVSAVQGSEGGSVSIKGLKINGLPITVSGLPNQTIGIPGGRVVINEQQTSSTDTVVNALHIAVTGVADVFVASAKAGVR
jgi:hypothetical protein